MASGSDFRSVGQTKLDSTGAGQVTLSPPGIEWNVTLTSVTVSSHVKEPTFRLYIDGVADLNFLEGSHAGSQDSSDTHHVVRAGQSLIGVWSGGDVGATATLRVSGRVG